MASQFRLPNGYAETYDRLLAGVALRSGTPTSMAVFWPNCGDLYARDLMVVGRAVDSWYREVSLHELRNLDGRRAVLEEKRNLSETDCMKSLAGAWGRK